MLVNVDLISNTQVLNHALLRSSMKRKKDHVENFIEHYDALGCKFREIGIYNLVEYSMVRALGSINLWLSNSKLPQLFTSTINFINEEIIIAQQIQRANYAGNVMKEVCNINTNLYNEELNGVGDKSLEKLCHQVA